MDRWTLLQHCAAQYWKPGWGDLGVLGVAMTCLYVSAALMTAYLSAKQWRSSPRTGSRWLWTFAAVYLIVLTINKQMDIQTYLTQTARCLSRAEGWYRDRRAMQKELTTAVLVLMALAVPAIIVLLKNAPPGNGLLILGLALLTGFVSLRLLSFHHVDLALRRPVLGLPGYRVFELSSLLLVNFAAAIKLRVA